MTKNLENQNVKNQKEYFKNAENIISIMIIFLCIIVLVIQVKNFEIGRKNIDLVYNIEKLGLNATDLGSDMVERPLGDFWVIGMNQIENTFVNSIIVCLILGFTIGVLLNEKETINLTYKNR